VCNNCQKVCANISPYGVRLCLSLIAKNTAVKFRWFDVSDVNECDDNTNQCDPLSTTCVNDPGSYHCSCSPGFYGPAGSMSCSGDYAEVSCCFIFCYTKANRKIDRMSHNALLTFVERQSGYLYLACYTTFIFSLYAV